MHQLMKTTKQKGKQIKTQKPNKKRQKDYNPDTGSTVQTRHRTKKTLEKTERAIMNAQSRDTDYIGHTRHWTKTKKKKEKIQPRTPTNIMHPLCYSYSQDVLETNIYFIILNVEVD